MPSSKQSSVPQNSVLDGRKNKYAVLSMGNHLHMKRAGDSSFGAKRKSGNNVLSHSNVTQKANRILAN